MTDNRFDSEHTPEPAPRPGRRRNVVVAAAVVAVLAIGGGVGYLVSGGGTKSTAGGAPVVSASPTPSPSAAGGSLQPGGPRSSSSAGTGIVQHATAYAAADAQLTVYFYARDCMRYSVTADESAAGKVLVTVVGVSTARPGQMCSMLIRLGHASTELRAPLGGRTVVDASTGKVLGAQVGRPGLPSGRVTHGPAPVTS